MNRTRPANPWWKRLQRRWRAWRGFADPKTHEVDWVWEQGIRYKRVSFATKATADQAAMALTAMAPTHCFPTLIRTERSTIWVEYIKKDRFSSLADHHLGAFFSTLYQHQAQSTHQSPATRVLATLSQDLKTLEQAKWLTPIQRQQLDALAHQVAPAMVIQGFDYVDAVKKNFVVSQGRAVGIDVEALLNDQWLGVGLAKAEYRGLVAGESVMSKLGPALAKQYPLVRLAFLARYFCEKIDQGKPKHIRLQALTDLI